MKNKKRDFISIKDLTKEEIYEIFKLAESLKAKRSANNSLSGKTLALIFQKPSNRTRVSFEVGMNQLGGNAVYLGPHEMELGVRESIRDAAKVLSRYIDGLVARTYKHQDIIDLAKSATVPVINGLSDLLHPCQGLSDLFTIKEKFKKLDSVKFVFIGDGNNVLHSLMHGAAIMGLDMTVVTPKGHGPKAEIVDEAKALSKRSGSSITLCNKPDEAIKGADIIYTDVWISMGQEQERERKIKDFNGFQVNKELLAKAKKDCVIMHCMPAHRNEEITDDVIDGPNSIVLDQAENRLHVQKAILHLLLR
ncbi:MAG: ornithine carbamoyltransferase [Candidatus Omnitrophica bacterium]|nr:ornithine carbamoyltransferase [Candidatus Omnitrophota bacterium]